MEDTTRFPFSIMLPVLRSDMESDHSSYNIVDRLATRAHSLCACGHQQLHWKLGSEGWPNCIVPLSESSCNFVWNFQMHFSVIFPCICDLEHWRSTIETQRNLSRKWLLFSSAAETVRVCKESLGVPRLGLFLPWLPFMLIVPLWGACVLLREGPHRLYCKWQKLGVVAWNSPWTVTERQNVWEQRVLWSHF